MAALRRAMRYASTTVPRQEACTSKSNGGLSDRGGGGGGGGLSPARQDRGVRWAFLGCPGVGKGTYASRLAQLLSVPHIATGDLVRDELAARGPLTPQIDDNYKKGQLVSDQIVMQLLSKRLKDREAKGESGFILDGFPRTIHQAEMLEGVIDIELVINLKLREDAVLAKCLGRRICSQCGGNFNIAAIDIKDEDGAPGVCMPALLPPIECASKLIQRLDDTEDVVKARLRIYHELSEPLVEFYRQRGKLLEFNLPGGIAETWPKLLQALNIKDNHGTEKSATA